jgi:O-antigen/teichoic acid export membrane protein/O-antigen ligase
LLTSPKSSPHQRSAPVARRLRPWAPLPGIRLAAVGGTMSARVIASMLSFAAGIVTARSLGTHGRALLALAIAIPAIFGVVGVLGLDNSNARFAGRSHSAFRQAVRRSVLFSGSAGCAMAAAWAMAGLRWPVLRVGLDPRLTVLSAMLCPISLLLTLLASAEIGRGRIFVYNTVTVSASAVYVVGVFALLLAGHVTVIGCVVACGAGQLCGVVALLAAAAVRVHPDGEKISMRRYTSYAGRAYLPNLAQYGMLRMDVPIVQALAGTTAVALYAVALPVAEGVMLLPTAVALVIFPRVTSGIVSQADSERIGQAVLMVTVLLAAAVAVTGPVLIPAVYGAPYRGSVAVVWSMLPGLVLFSAGRTHQAYLSATDRLRPVIWATAAAVVAGLAGLIGLVPRIGALGAGIADSLGYCAFAVIVLVALGRHREEPGAMAKVQTMMGRLVDRALHLRLPSLSLWPALMGGAAITGGLAMAGLSTGRPGMITTFVGIGVLVTVLVIPGAGLTALAVVCPLSQTSFGSSLVTEKDLILLTLAAVLSHIVAGRVVRPRPLGLAVTVTCISYFLVSATLSGAADGAAGNWRYVMMLGIPLLLIPLIADGGYLARRAVLISGCVTAGLAMVEIGKSRASLSASTGSSAASSALTAASNTGAVNHNAEGAVFVLALGVLLARFPRARGAERLALTVAIPALVAGIGYSFSRSAYFGAMTVIALFALRRSIKGLACAGAAAGCVAAVLPSAVRARLGTVWNSSGLDVSSALRVDLWSSALRMFDAHPAFGVGYLNFATDLPAYYVNTGTYDTFIIQFSQLDFAHNTYLTVLAETGLAGAVLVGVLIAIALRRAWPAARSGDWAGEAALLAMAGVGVCSFFGEVLLVPPILTVFLLAVLASRSRPKGVEDAGAHELWPGSTVVRSYGS